jgi:hypothetical protein
LGTAIIRVIRSAKTRYRHGGVLAVPAIRSDRIGISVEFMIFRVRDKNGELNELVAIKRDVT